MKEYTFQGKVTIEHDVTFKVEAESWAESRALVEKPRGDNYESERFREVSRDVEGTLEEKDLDPVRKFTVELSCVRLGTARVEVEAASEAEAKALELGNSGNMDWKDQGIPDSMPEGELVEVNSVVEED